MRQNEASVAAAWKMLHSLVRRVDFVMELVSTMQDVIRYLMAQHSAANYSTKEPPFQLVSCVQTRELWNAVLHFLYLVMVMSSHVIVIRVGDMMDQFPPSENFFN